MCKSLCFTLLITYPSSGQFLLEQSRLSEVAEMAERAAELDNSEFDVVFSAAHMLRFPSLLLAWIQPTVHIEDYAFFCRI